MRKNCLSSAFLYTSQSNHSIHIYWAPTLCQVLWANQNFAQMSTLMSQPTCRDVSKIEALKSDSEEIFCTPQVVVGLDVGESWDLRSALVQWFFSHLSLRYLQGAKDGNKRKTFKPSIWQPLPGSELQSWDQRNPFENSVSVSHLYLCLWDRNLQKINS